MKRLLFIPGFLVLAACGAHNHSSSSAKVAGNIAQASRVIYQKAYDCGSSAELDVDTGERRNLKLVIKDSAAINYLESKLTSGSHLSNDVLGPDGNNETTRGVLRFIANTGMFKPSDLSGAELDEGFTGDANEYADLHKEADGIKIRLANFANVRVTCGDGGPIGEQCAFGVKTTVLKEDANWFFHCKAAF